MKYFKNILLIFLSFLLISVLVILPTAYTFAISTKNSQTEGSESDLLENVIQFANKSSKFRLGPMSQFAILLKYSHSLPSGEITLLEPAPPTDSNITEIQMTTRIETKNNPFFLLDAVIELTTIHNLRYESRLGLPSSLTSSNSPPTFQPMEYVEIFTNALAGSVFAQRRLAEIKINNFRLFKLGLETFVPIITLSLEEKKTYFLEYARAKGIVLSSADSYESLLIKFFDSVDIKNTKKLVTLSTQAKAAQRKNVQDYKAGATARELLVQGPALNQMIKNNDREGVATAMQTMLPWSLMEPTEKKFWSDFVESIRHPNYADAPILFRGIDNKEKFQPVFDSNGKLISGAILSKRLTAGSGSHLFKLKGLPDTFQTLGTSGATTGKSISPAIEPHTLTKMMLNHANDPMGSPFVSLTSSLNIAWSFMDEATLDVDTPEKLAHEKEKFLNSNAAGGLATVRMDRRRLLANSVSGFASELEVLASMFVFPDEIIYLEKGLKMYTFMKNPQKKIKDFVTPEVYYARARQAVYQKTGITLPENLIELEANGAKEFNAELKNLDGFFRTVRRGIPARCEVLFK